MIKKVLVWIVGVLILSFFAVNMFQEKIIFLSEKLDKDYQFKFEQPFEEINLKTSDNETINGLYFTVNNPKGAILFFHGNKGNLTRWGKIVQCFKQFQYNVFVIDYRGYGKSTGKFNEGKMYEDALLSYDFLKQKFSENQIVVYGRSLGTTFATKVASENNPKQLILESPFYSLPHAVKHQFKFGLNSILRYQFPTFSFIEKVQSPVLIFHGLEDKVTSPNDTRDLLKLINHTKKKSVLIDEGTHHNLRDFERYKTELQLVL
ncbi:alpha/beta hydrolase [Tenacibaculum sp. S7007]|uniref:Alpha/beta hydrolase n=1 Tax=Tenacibaculum pelagium TaxID=2759527 RepID=A0A839ALU5_9FLAO|nr:alpha/beta hydrolase [Tenacibaculum pelagium]MBA6156073.1 alpha/beta hydrolase [Tenacibaculum pelagium]